MTTEGSVWRPEPDRHDGASEGAPLYRRTRREGSPPTTDSGVLEVAPEPPAAATGQPHFVVPEPQAKS